MFPDHHQVKTFHNYILIQYSVLLNILLRASTLVTRPHLTVLQLPGPGHPHRPQHQLRAPVVVRLRPQLHLAAENIC